MSGTLASIADYKAYHILSYGTLLGATVFQSFVGGVVAYKCLPRPQFATLQQNIFPIFFAMQTILPLVMIATYPGEKLLGIGGEYVRENVGITGVLAETNRWSVLVPFSTMLITSAANMFFLGPMTTKKMKERHHQETRDGKKSYEPGPHSPAMEKLNKEFARLHGISTIFNLSGLGAMLYYAWVLGSKI